MPKPTGTVAARKWCRLGVSVARREMIDQPQLRSNGFLNPEHEAAVAAAAAAAASMTPQFDPNFPASASELAAQTSLMQLHEEVKKGADRGSFEGKEIKKSLFFLEQTKRTKRNKSN